MRNAFIYAENATGHTCDFQIVTLTWIWTSMNATNVDLDCGAVTQTDAENYT